jgi:hypothetical protein
MSQQLKKEPEWVEFMIEGESIANNDNTTETYEEDSEESEAPCTPSSQGTQSTKQSTPSTYLNSFAPNQYKSPVFSSTESTHENTENQGDHRDFDRTPVRGFRSLNEVYSRALPMDDMETLHFKTLICTTINFYWYMKNQRIIKKQPEILHGKKQRRMSWTL